MGKRQHQKDKMYITCTEWGTLYGGKRANLPPQKISRLPLHYCCLTFSPYEHPYCDRDGNIFELDAILKYYQRYKCNPITGKPLDPKSLVKLNFLKNENGKFQCPVLLRELTPHSHVVAVATTGNVFLYEAVERLNIKPKSLRDLLTDTPYKRSDLITLQDPADPGKFRINTFHHVKNEHKLEDDEETDKDKSNIKNVNKEMREIMKTLDDEYVPVVSVTETKEKADKFNAAHYSTGAVAAGFTSTVMAPLTVHEPGVLHEDEVRYSRVKAKGYVRLVTNMGNLNLELYCDQTPKTCENFIKLCQKGYYNNTIFHRSIRHFMIQGGDPTGTGTGGQSYWGKPFKDEFRPNLTHTGRGVLSMANSGSDTNKSQFFITYRSCKYLDKKHTVFGKVVGGLETLNAFERIEVDNKDKPIEDIKLITAQVFVDPYQDVDEKLAEERLTAQEQVPEVPVEKKKRLEALLEYRKGVGKYINPSVVEPEPNDDNSATKPKKSKSGYSFGNFSGW